jgi:hypothetical protein
MALTRRQIRQRVGQRELGIIYVGTMTVTGAETQAIDTSDNSPMDPGDNALRYNGAGLLVRSPAGGTGIAYRQNVTYVPATQELTIAAISGLTGTPEYELHLEPLLHPLLIWPGLIDDALALIRRISFQHILFTNRNYYDLTDWAEIVGPEQVRRLYSIGTNLLQNPKFDPWPVANLAPNNWTGTGAGIVRGNIEENVPHSVGLDPAAVAETLEQIITLSVANRRVKCVVWARNDANSQARLTLQARRSGPTVEDSQIVTFTTASGQRQLEAEVETTSDTASVRILLDNAGADASTATFWAPMLYDLAMGRRSRVKPITTMLAGQGDAGAATMKLYVPYRSEQVGQMALLLPYPALGAVATTTADDVATSAPDELVIAAVATQVLRWLVTHPQIPSTSKTEYRVSLQTWEARFRQRARTHMRKIAKTQEMWEASELN